MKKTIAILLTLSLLFGSMVSVFSNTSNSKFKDNADISGYALDAVNWAVNNDIITGYDDNTFRPRVDMPERHWAAILTRYITLGQIPATKSGEHWADPVYRVAQDYKLPFKGFNDVGIRSNAINRGDVARTVAAAYGFDLNLEQAVEFMYDNEFSVGTDPDLMNFNTYGVNNSLTRQQAVVFIHRINSIVSNKGGVVYRGTFYPMEPGNLPGVKDGGKTFQSSPDWSRFNIKDSSETISDVIVLMRNNRPEIRIKTTNPLTYKVTELESTDRSILPDRLVFDFDNAKFNITNKSRLLPNGTLAIEVNDNDIVTKVRASQFEVEPFKTRVVLEVNELDEYEVYFDEFNHEMVITFNSEDKPPVNRGQDRDTSSTLNSINMDYVQGREIIFLDGIAIDDINVSELSEPKRLVIDIKNTEVSSELLNKGAINLDGRVAKSVRISQFKPERNYENTDKVARVVIDLYEHIDVNDFTFEINKNNIAIYLEQLNQSLVYEQIDWSSLKLTLQANQVTNFTSNFDAVDNFLILTVPKNDIDLVAAKMEYNDSFVEFINIREVNNQYRLEIKLKDDIRNEIITPLNTKEMVIQFNDNKSKNSDVLIVIDPGHGGDDPGAISPNLKMYESHIVLDVSHRLNKLLQEAGFRTYMTRVDDVRILNPERAEIANQLNADLFISVHANAFIRPDVNGIETHYYPCEKDTNDHRNNKALAQLFQNEKIKFLQGSNRGIYPRENIIVLRDTKMPAVLSEIGFLTNPIEEAKLATDEYRQKSAEAMFSAIVKYFD